MLPGRTPSRVSLVYADNCAEGSTTANRTGRDPIGLPVGLSTPTGTTAGPKHEAEFRYVAALFPT